MITTTRPKPLTLTTTDLTQTRNQPCHMRWPLDRETTARLRRVIVSGDEKRASWWRKVIRRLVT